MLYYLRPHARPIAHQVRLNVLAYSLCVEVNFSAIVRVRLMILGQQFLLDETI